MQSVPITTNVALRKILRLPYKIYIYEAKHLFCLVEYCWQLYKIVHTCLFFYINLIKIRSLTCSPRLQIYHGMWVLRRSTLENTEGAIKNGQSREVGYIGYEQKHNAICIEHHYAQTNTDSVARYEPPSKQLEVKTNRISMHVKCGWPYIIVKWKWWSLVDYEIG